MARKKRSRNNNTYSRKSRVYTRVDPLRSFFGMDVSRPRFELSSPNYSPSRKTEPQAPKKRRMAPKQPPTPTPTQTFLHTPSQVINNPVSTVCSRRKSRKEVIHAFNHAGKAGQKPQKRNATSNISCKG